MNHRRPLAFILIGGGAGLLVSLLWAMVVVALLAGLITLAVGLLLLVV